MSLLLVRSTILVLSLMLLSSFRMAAGDRPAEPLLYDVRGALVTARADVSAGLIGRTDRLVDEAIRATFRQNLLLRAILTVRILKTRQVPLVIGGRFEAEIFVKATAVGNGEPLAAGTFTVSSFAFSGQHADQRLAERIAERVAREFRLDTTSSSTLASALFP
ncbi:hypothetical protein [Rhizobium sp. SSA_523]|uniref:hypothetical protein n=1 Tax=Rhizobium sp. SSA_523 TaxID=2952477 RepID=UPI00209081D4|nr:hypothetical protein [Rhizobium sp. SSA_523]MCO5733864.1 hypothetical protein [Rhizobium sp. SSA_523]WKC24869.1 hypothetical protein QTJ18_12700 [Rhizobium sp. SSA_523]